MDSSWSCEALRVGWRDVNGACQLCGVTIGDTVICRHAWQVTQRYLVAGEPVWQTVAWRLQAAAARQLVFVAPLGPAQGEAVELQLRLSPAAHQAAGLSFQGLALELGTTSDVPLPGEVRLALPLELTGWLDCVQDLYTPSKADVIGSAWRGFQPGNWQAWSGRPGMLPGAELPPVADRQSMDQSAHRRAPLQGAADDHLRFALRHP